MNNFKDLLSDFLKQHHDIFYSLVYDSCENTRREACLVYSKKLYEYFNKLNITSENINLPNKEDNIIIPSGLNSSIPIVAEKAEVPFEIKKAKTKYKSIIKAAEKGNLEAVETFIKNGVNVEIKNSNGRTALMLASRGGHTEVVKLLLDAGADIEAKGKDGMTALILASCHGYPEIVKLLLERGANVKIRNIFGYTSLRSASINGHAEVADLLEQHGAKE